MRILMVAPEQPRLNTIPEIRIITQKHHVTLLNGGVTADDVYLACRMANYQVIHFATHSNATMVALSDGATLGADDIAQLARMADTECVVFNSCLSNQLASYCVRHGVSYVIYSNIELPDAEAWKFPAAFYDALSNGHSRDIVGSFTVADNGDGEYGLAISPTVYQKYADAVTDLRKQLANTVNLAPKTVISISMAVVASMLLMIVVMALLSGRWF